MARPSGKIGLGHRGGARPSPASGSSRGAGAPSAVLHVRSHSMQVFARFIHGIDSIGVYAPTLFVDRSPRFAGLHAGISRTAGIEVSVVGGIEA